MKTIGYGLVQIPIVSRYKVCCISRSLAGGVTSTGWQEIIGCALRILLLSSWGMQSIDYSLPQTATKIVGVYIELTILALQVANGIIILFGLWSNNLFLLYPSFLLIPLCFLIDIIVKGSCYAALFLTPKVTVFGALSLIEVWIRGLSLMYGWIVIISYVYYKKKDWKLTAVDVELNTRSPDRVSTLLRRTSSKSPFSRNSSLSRKGRRSFLLRNGTKNRSKSKSEIVGLTGPRLGDPEDKTVLPDTLAYRRQDSGDEASLPGGPGKNKTSSNGGSNTVVESGGDAASEILLGESATMSLRRKPDPKTQYSQIISDNNPTSTLRTSPPAKYKKRGGFIPEVLRTPSKLGKPCTHEQVSNARRLSPTSSHSGLKTTAIAVKPASSVDEEDSSSHQTPLLQSDKNSKQPLSVPEPRSGPPSLPNRPPVGPTVKKPKDHRIWSWVTPVSTKQKKKDAGGTASTSSLGTHIQNPVLV